MIWVMRAPPNSPPRPEPRSAPPRGLLFALAGLALGLALGCDETKPAAPLATPASADEAPPVAPALPAGHVVPRGSALALSAAAQREAKPPLTAPAQESLKLPSGAARVWAPVGARLAQPVLAVLTTQANPEACATWSQLKGEHGFLLCPPPTESAELTSSVLKQAIAALEQRHPGHVAPRSTLVAYAEAADGALLLMREKPSLFPRGFLVGGGYAAFTASAVHAFALQGGERVVFACAGCDADRAVTALIREGLRSRRVDQAQPATEALKAEWEWLRQDDPWWQPAAAR